MSSDAQSTRPDIAEIFMQIKKLQHCGQIYVHDSADLYISTPLPKLLAPPYQ